jgi:serine/threonine-protein kinase RsbW
MACAKQGETMLIVDRMKRQPMQLTIASDPIAVRDALTTLLAGPEVQFLGATMRGTAEIVLAEVLNNIVEHAYAEDCGEISVHLRQQSTGVQVIISDQGRPFPQDSLPQGTLPQIDSPDDLPEGGFGWFLIRTLVQDLTYNRKEAHNHLSFFLSAEAGRPYCSA